MAASTNVYVLTEKPPILGRIDGKRAGEQIQEFLRELAKYTRLHVRDGVQIPSLNKLMEEEDLEMLRVVMTGLFEEDDLALHPEDYRILEGSDDEEPDDAEAVALRRRAARAALRGETIPLSASLSAAEGTLDEEVSDLLRSAAAPPRPSRKAQTRKRVDDRRKAFEENSFSEESLLAGLRLLYGPQNLQQADEV
jgi:hypothetical protein